MTWVVSVDEKKNRVALTALSPAERAAAEAAAAQEKQNKMNTDAATVVHQVTLAGIVPLPPKVNQPVWPDQEEGECGGTGQPRSGTGQARSGASDGRRSGGQHGSGQQGGGRARGQQSQGRGKGGPPHSKSVVVTSKKPKANIHSSDERGEEPLRSFSDLMQFYQAKRTDDTPPPPPKSPDAPPADESKCALVVTRTTQNNRIKRSRIHQEFRGLGNKVRSDESLGDFRYN